ncbi:hypothetical protein GGI43DRAFT_99786 [Trichoderma evansii]
MSTTSSSDAANRSQSCMHTCTTTQSQESMPATSSDPFRIMLPMGLLFSRLRASTWVRALCSAASTLKNMKVGFWSHVMVVVPLLIAILTLWPTFTGTVEAKKATELAKWTARKDFMEFCQSFDWEPAGCDLQPDSLGPPPVVRRQLPFWPSESRMSSTFSPITLVALSFGIVCLMVKFQKRHMRSLLQGSFHRLSRYQHNRRALPTPLLSVLNNPEIDHILQPAPIVHSTGLDATDHAPRRRLVGSDGQHRLQIPALDEYDRTEDDNDIKLQPERHVDYLSHVWREEDLYQSWRHVQSQKSKYDKAARLENAAWRSWTKFKNNLPTVSPTLLNWLKDEDVTWLCGPLQPRTTELYALTSNVSKEKRERSQKRRVAKHAAALQAEEGNQYVTICGQLGLDAGTTQTSRPTFQQGGNLKHSRHFGKSFAKNLSIQAERKEVRFKEDFEQNVKSTSREAATQRYMSNEMRRVQSLRFVFEEESGE